MQHTWEIIKLILDSFYDDDDDENDEDDKESSENLHKPILKRILVPLANLD